MAAERVKTVEDRKARKPLLERKRRARINDSLAELKGIVLRSLNKDSSRYTKMEKADILEMAVKHLKALRETVNSYPRHDGTSHYKNGFTQCATEVTRYIMGVESIDDNTRSDILSHLNNTCQSMHMSASKPPTSPPLSPIITNLSHCTAHEDPCYRCYPLPYPQPHFLNQPPELLPGNTLSGPHAQMFGHPTSPNVPYLEKSLTKSYSDSSLVKMAYGYPFPRSPTTHCHSTPNSPKSSVLSTPTTREPSQTRSEPVWRPW
ncbi:transcription factor HES-4-like [Dendronephthya gigantea]|uniref:transcription factor HES-4-like n=1 Tax=Dendronephthya gigantea TaxID=151771 RepID=UPI001069DD04|nr:transcription factor HES-4-like [Dendronephthya gigantea]